MRLRFRVLGPRRIDHIVDLPPELGPVRRWKELIVLALAVVERVHAHFECDR
jgi:hypothetical protein